MAGAVLSGAHYTTRKHSANASETLHKTVQAHMTMKKRKAEKIIRAFAARSFNYSIRDDR